MSFSKYFYLSLALISFSSVALADNPQDSFKESSDWISATNVSVAGKKLQIDNKKADAATILVNTGDFSKIKYLVGKY